MKHKRRFLPIVLFLGLALVLGACGGEEAGSGSDNNDTDFISVLTGGTEGTYYPLGGSFAKIINTHVDKVEATATSTGASVENMNKLKDGKDDLIAFTQTDIASYAVDGKQMFEGKPIDSIRAIGALYPETIQIVATAKSGIRTVEDLAGKKVSVGAPGAGTYASAEDILALYGMSMDDIDAQNLDFGESTSGMQDGTIDAAIITAGTPTGAVESLAASTDISIVSLDENKIAELKEELPYYSEFTIPKGTYGLKGDVKTVAVQSMLVTTEGMDKDLVYNITKAIFEHTDAIGHQKKEDISADTALNGVGIELHPGAKKYFDEKGIKK
ncbi:TAXI family TRAP transporter solute-binding subunit [Sporolactobacillus sp. Y61]|uniref:TAXI family TRAP transporter solute-binding subunit n=1 Tax=Sporolactobacillus sp. Y61 TaxID=3160863 RepID=A0AAU8IJ32_9BACL